MTLTTSDFSAWCEAVHQQTPFPWQQRLLERVVSRAPSGGWPRTLALPTSSGKTSTLDVALFALAIQLASHDTGPRTMPLRIALVVDRRIVVDAAHARAVRIKKALDSAESPIVRRVAEALRRTGADEPLHVALLRGGIYREDRWARSPNQPTILCSTVDQVGSRLLHRGYGVSPATWPIHAGLLGNDTLIVLDEAHCSVPFHQTLAAVERFRAHAQKPLDLPFVVCAMTATPRDDATPFALESDDLQNAVLARRLSAPKPVKLEPVAKLVAAMSARAVEQARGGRTVLAVVNRVRTARDLHRAIADALQKKNAGVEADVLLLTGRSRGVQRDKLLSTYSDRLMAGRKRDELSPAARALIVVATQCVEVGADLDVDALLTEACPLDALRQRLGRLNRLGDLASAPCFVFGPTEHGPKKSSKSGDTPAWLEDKIYGESLARTWSWLVQQAEQGPIDGGVRAFAARCAGAGRELDAPASDAPSMLPAYCDLWAQTAPAPSVGPEPALFLHGPQSATPEVQVVWRADLVDEADADADAWIDTIALCPPVVGETLTLRRDVVRQWLSHELDARGEELSADVEAAHEPEAKTDREAATPRRFLLWRGVEDSEVTTDLSVLRHGDTIVVPAGYGGCDAFGWDPGRTEPVEDLALEARIASRRAPVLRLHANTLGAEPPDAARALTGAPGDELDEEALQEALAQLAAQGATDELKKTAGALLDAWTKSRKALLVHPHPSGRGLVLVGRAGLALEAQDFSDEDETSSCLPKEITLDLHLGDVRDSARLFCGALGLTRSLVEDVCLAGWLHDLGKADPRFQAWLRGGNALAARKGALLAKSPKVPPNRAAMRAARERSGYPRGGRHELLSVRLAESNGGALLERAHDRELVLHLIESHHGHCRPFAPAVFDERPLKVHVAHDGAALEASSETGLERVDSGVGERFFRLTRRYGWWGLSYLEACMRLADHRASELEAKGAAR